MTESEEIRERESNLWTGADRVAGAAAGYSCGVLRRTIRKAHGQVAAVMLVGTE